MAIDIFDFLKKGGLPEDEDFDKIYSKSMRAVSETHFTPVEIAKSAAQFLVQKKGDRILDIGSGAGKFCMVGAACTDGHFTGVEQREELHLSAERLKRKYQLVNINFLHANIKQVDFNAYQGFYFFNSFYENILQYERIDESIEVKKDFYQDLSAYVAQQLDVQPIGTRLVTFFSSYDEVPESYSMQYGDDRIKLTFWEKLT